MFSILYTKYTGINQISGVIRPCDILAGSGGVAPETEADCRIGHDTNLCMYSAV